MSDNISVDFLLDSEIQDLEKNLHDKYGKQEIIEELPQTENKNVEAPEINKKTTKAQLISNYIELCNAAKLEYEPENKLKRYTKQELIKKIADVMNFKIADVPLNETAIRDEKPQQIELNPEKLNLVAEGLFQMNIALCSVFETGSQYIKHKTYDVAVLENWTMKVAGKHNELVNIFRQMYMDYKETFDKYLSPVVQWSVIMLQTSATTVIENIKKKKEITENE
jgi:hypothetical protein